MLDREWLDRPYVSRISAASAAALRPLRNSYNAHLAFEEQIKPFNFLLCVHVAPFSHPDGYPPERFQLVAPFERDPRRWLEMEWTDHYSGQSFRIHTDGSPSPNSIKVKTNRNVLDRYRTHPEPKSLGAGCKPCDRQTAGLLQRRPVTVTEIVYIGKESNRLEDATAGLVHELGDILNAYNDPRLDPWRTLVIPVLKAFSTAEIAARADLDRRTIERFLSGRSYPRRMNRNKLVAIAAELAAGVLATEPPRPPLAVLREYRDSASAMVRVCTICGAELHNARAIYCSSACKKRAYRNRRAPK